MLRLILARPVRAEKDGHMATKTNIVGLLGLAAAATLTLAPSDAHAQYDGGYGRHSYGPRRTYWEPGDPVPRGYRAVPRIRTGLVVAGAVTFGVTYLTTALIGAAVSDVRTATGSFDRSSKLLMIPLFGPFTLLGSTVSATGQLGLVLDGLVQAAGIGMFVTGLVWPKLTLVPAGYGENKVDAPPKLEITPMPMPMGVAGGGMGLVGKF
jgi:hypothetical protein